MNWMAWLLWGLSISFFIAGIYSGWYVVRSARHEAKVYCIALNKAVWVVFAYPPFYKAGITENDFADLADRIAVKATEKLRESFPLTFYCIVWNADKTKFVTKEEFKSKSE